jgi:hypothetical protein
MVIMKYNQGCLEQRINSCPTLSKNQMEKIVTTLITYSLSFSSFVVLILSHDMIIDNLLTI